jgi:hypothetical protein
VKLWLALVVIVAVVAAGCGSTAAVIPVTSRATTQQRQTKLAALVLSLRDLGSGYNQNAGATRPEPFSDAAAGDSPAIVALLHRAWVGGYEAGYTSAEPDHPGVWCAADVFRSTKLGRIARAWKADGMRQLGGTTSAPVPRGAPGRPLFFFRGHATLAGYPVIVVVYGWQRGHTIGHLSVANQSGMGLVAVAMRMARLEDAHLRAFH